MEKIPMPNDYMIGAQLPGETPAPGISGLVQFINALKVRYIKERDITRRHKEIAEESDSPLIKFLLQQIIYDEEKHLAIIHTMISTLQESLDSNKTAGAIHLLGKLGENREELLKLTADFMKTDKEGIRESKALLKSSKGYYQGLFALLLKSIIQDSEKHVDIFEFLRRRLKT